MGIKLRVKFSADSHCLTLVVVGGGSFLEVSGAKLNYAHSISP